jgi:protein-arginine kinase activator protein McsA
MMDDTDLPLSDLCEACGKAPAEIFVGKMLSSGKVALFGHCQACYNREPSKSDVTAPMTREALIEARIEAGETMSLEELVARIMGEDYEGEGRRVE